MISQMMNRVVYGRSFSLGGIADWPHLIISMTVRSELTKNTIPGSTKSISENIAIYDKLTFQLFFESGGNRHLSDVYDTAI